MGRESEIHGSLRKIELLKKRGTFHYMQSTSFLGYFFFLEYIATKPHNIAAATAMINAVFMNQPPINNIFTFNNLR